MSLKSARGKFEGPNAATWQLRSHLRHLAVLSLIPLTLAGCYKRSVMPQSEGHVATAATAPQLADVPQPARTSDFVPPPKPTVKAPTYSVVVNEVPVKELLFALARDTKQNIDIHPGLTGLVTLNAINETLPAILDRISKQVNLRYRTEGNTIIVSPDICTCPPCCGFMLPWAMAIPGAMPGTAPKARTQAASNLFVIMETP